jgi:large subunit ribosomal protein L15
MKLNEVRDNPGSSKARIRVGRGIGSGKGKQSGRGGKGQTARSGVRIKGFEGGQMPLHRRLPKRGFTPPNQLSFNEVNLGRIQKAIDAGKLGTAEPITVESLIKAGVVTRRRDGVKILGVGELTTKASFEVEAASKSAAAAIEKAGGSLKTLRQQETPAAPSAS